MRHAKTSERLLQAMRDSAKRAQTPDEARRQRVSYVVGALGRRSGITRETIERVLDGRSSGRA